MPLTLITGPANAAKAGAVLERFRAALAREPVLVVPTPADAEHYQRELAAEGIVLGAEVATFSRLVRAIAEATGVRPRVVGPVARERVVRLAVADVRLDVLARSAAAPGFAAAAGALFAELGRSLVGPARFAAALRDWEDAPAHAGELAAMFSAYHRRLERLGVVDPEGLARAALDALRGRPAAWGGRPVFVYGFDDLTPLQRDAVETLARHADVCVALAYEPGRAAFAGRAGTVELLKPLADRHELLADRSEHYAPNARAALHHLERGLFEPGMGRAAPNGAVRLLEAGGERAEAELVAAEVLELTGAGVLPDDIAVLVRGGADEAEVLGQVLESYGVPVSLERRVRLARTRLGAGVLAAARAALRGGTAADVMTWLRTPGRIADPDLADRLETHARRAELKTAAELRRLVTAELLAALDALADAAAAGPEAFLDAVVAEADAIWTAPHRRAAAVLGPEEAADARAAAALRAAAAELRVPELAGEPAELLTALADVRVREPAVPGAVLVADPLAIRARRFRAVFVCGLQESEFPRHPVPEPFLDDAARIDLARASGLVLPRHEDVLARERYLLYAAVSRPEEVLFLSFRSSDEEGDPALPSPFVDDVRALFTDELWERRGRRLLAEVTWPAGSAPTPHELRRARAAAEDCPEPLPLAPPRAEPVLSLLAARDTEAARNLETFAGCGVRWLVESVLRPQPAEPDPEPVRRGSIAHGALEQTLRRLRERTGSARLTAASLPAALEELGGAMAERRAAAGGTRARAALRELEVDLRRLLTEEAESGAGLEPQRLEWGFGGERDEHGPLPLPEAGLGVTGRVDRIDVDTAGRALVRDYKGRRVSAGARWERDNKLQVALYALAVRDLLGLETVGALYQPIGARDVRPRGLVRDDVPGRYVNGDVVSAEELDAGLEAARTVAARAATDMRAGRINACPDACTPMGTCAYPAICRAGEATPEQAA
ncbi:MAG TPA: PD-(D/E)XK nuclease family protein [Solirubrobacteraceae bacterium]|nr:PD-(D/E)XK nuclease family protein [Solirubrobacteraceae bacterium]